MGEVVKARLDADRTARPLSQLFAVYPAPVRTGDHITGYSHCFVDPIRYELCDELGAEVGYNLGTGGDEKSTK